jgi:hypothetical protein
MVVLRLHMQNVTTYSVINAKVQGITLQETIIVKRTTAYRIYKTENMYKQAFIHKFTIKINTDNLKQNNPHMNSDVIHQCQYPDL